MLAYKLVSNFVLGIGSFVQRVAFDRKWRTKISKKKKKKEKKEEQRLERVKLVFWVETSRFKAGYKCLYIVECSGLHLEN